MFLKKIEIENFMAYSSHAEMNLVPNNNQIKRDIELKKILETDSDIFLPVISLGGANSVGKTSLLNAIINFFHIIDNNISAFLSRSRVYFMIEKYLPTLNNYLSVLHWALKKLESDIPFSFSHTLNDEKVNKFIDLVSKEETKAGNILANSKTEVKKFLNEIMKTFERKESEKWLYNKHFPFKKTELKFTFHSKYYKNFIIKISDSSCETNSNETFWRDNVLNTINIQYFDINENPIKITQKLKDEIKTYLKSFTDLTSKDLRYDFSLRPSNFINWNYFLEKLGMDTLNKILKIADNSFFKLKVETDEITKIKRVDSALNIDGSTISVDKFSDGTKRFFVMICRILIFFQNNDEGLFIFDEIDESLHWKLIDVIKQLFFMQNKNKCFQLLFTSHNPIVLSSLLSNKEIFFIDKNIEGNSLIFKVSQFLRTNNNTLNAFLYERVGSHPNDSFINEFLVWYKKNGEN